MTDDQLLLLMVLIPAFFVLFLVIFVIVVVQILNAVIRTPKEICKNRVMLARILDALRSRNQ